MKSRLSLCLLVVTVTPASRQGPHLSITHSLLGYLLETSGSNDIFSARRKYMGPNNKIFKFALSHIEIRAELLFLPLLLCVLPSHIAGVAYIRF